MTDPAANSPSRPPIVRFTLGWRAREVARQSNAPVRFPDEDRSTVILENDPVALVYADPAHGFALPPGRYLRLDQAAGRVHTMSTTPQLEALPVAQARMLVDSVGRLLAGAGWRWDPALGGMGVGEAFAAAARSTFGLTHIATWRIPRPTAPWAAPPPGTVVSQDSDFWDGPQAEVSLNTLHGQPPDGGTRFLVQVRVTDYTLRRGLYQMVGHRERRFGGRLVTLTEWDANPDEPITPPARPAGR